MTDMQKDVFVASLYSIQAGLSLVGFAVFSFAFVRDNLHRVVRFSVVGFALLFLCSALRSSMLFAMRANPILGHPFSEWIASGRSLAWLSINFVYCFVLLLTVVFSGVTVAANRPGGGTHDASEEANERAKVP